MGNKRLRRETPARVLPVPKHVPQNHHVPGTIALSFFAQRGLYRP